MNMGIVRAHSLKIVVFQKNAFTTQYHLDLRKLRGTIKKKRTAYIVLLNPWLCHIKAPSELISLISLKERYLNWTMPGSGITIRSFARFGAEINIPILVLDRTFPRYKILIELSMRRLHPKSKLAINSECKKHSLAKIF